MSELDKQVGGNHYKTMPFQPIQFSYLTGINFLEGCVVKYVTRYKAKNGIADLDKAIHYCRVIEEFEYQRYKAGYWSLFKNLLHHMKRKLIGRWNFYKRRKLVAEFCDKNNLDTDQTFVINIITTHDCAYDLESAVQFIEQMKTQEFRKRFAEGVQSDDVCK